MPGIILDTEGSGLFDFKRAAEAEGQPRLAELAMIALHDNNEIAERFQMYIKPDGWKMTPGATEVNGLTTDFLMEFGEPIHVVLDTFENLIRNGYFVIAHNAQHDMKQIRGEFKRAGRDDLFDITKNVCTMRKAMNLSKMTGRKIVKLNGKGGFPGLVDLCAYFNLPQPKRKPNGEHSAADDCDALLPVYRKLLDSGIDMTPEVHRHADYETIKNAK